MALALTEHFEVVKYFLDEEGTSPVEIDSHRCTLVPGTDRKEADSAYNLPRD